MTSEQIAWAARHDWFKRDNRDGTITVEDEFIFKSDPEPRQVHRQLRIFRDYADLRRWAGY